MHERFRGEVAYNGEVDIHFPHLTVGQTLTFSTTLRTPHRRLDNMPRKKAIHEVVTICLTVFGLRHTFNTKVGVQFAHCSVDIRMIMLGASAEANENGSLLQRRYDRNCRIDV